MRADLRYAIRSLRSSRGFTLTALAVLVLGLGSTIAIFSVVDAVVLRALPFDEHDRLVAVGERYDATVRRPGGDPAALGAAAPQNYVDWAAEQRVFDSIAAIASGWLTLREPGGEPESLIPQRVTSGFFDVLRVRPALGRPFTPADEAEGRQRVVILSDGLWRRRFGGDPSIVGRTIPLEDLEGGRASAEGGYEVVGVMPPSFTYPVAASRPTDVWIPYVVPERQRVRDPAARANYLQVIARLRPGVSVSQAQAQLDRIAVALEQAHPQWNRGNRIGVRPLAEHLIGAQIRSWMWLLLGAVAVVLLIAAANIANLLLVRATARARETAIRAALGASRWRLTRELLVESLLLAGAGVTLALVAARWAIDLLRAAMPDGIPRVSSIALDARVVVASVFIAVVTALVFGLVPTLQLWRPDIGSPLKDGGRGTGGEARQWLRDILVVGEVALAVVLLVGASLFVGSFVSLMRIEPGFDPRQVLVTQIAPRVTSPANPADAGPALTRIVERLQHVPGVTHAAAVSGASPLLGFSMRTTVTVPGMVEDLNSPDAMISLQKVTPAYHAALRVPLRCGRYFEDTDTRGSAPVVLLNESAARKYFAGEDPIGRAVSLQGERTVVGVVGDVRQTALEQPPAPEAYVPLAQSAAYGGELVVRSDGNPRDVIAGVRAAVFAEMPDVPLRNVTTLDERVARLSAQRRLSMLLLALFGVLGLVIAAVGVYGTLAYVVSQRTREIGVRMALGATRRQVVSLIVTRAAVLVASGLFAGGAAARYLGATARTFLFELEPTDPRAFAAAALVLAAAAIIASVIPARRAAAVDPMVAMKAE